jgi:hypothetical protein
MSVFPDNINLKIISHKNVCELYFTLYETKTNGLELI